MIQTNVPLKDYSNYQIGGPAKYFLAVNSLKELTDGLVEFGQKGPIFILGRATNVLIGEKGFDGLVIYDHIKGIENKNGRVIVGAGVLISDLLKYCIQNGLSGLEWAGGLPGTVGGAVRGNAGAFSGETKDSVLEVKCVNLKTLKTIKRSNQGCNFSYRSSIFKTRAYDEMIVQVAFGLKPGDKISIENSIREKIDYRNLKHPMDLPSLGSTFKNIPVVQLSNIQREKLMQYVKDDPFPVIPVAKLLYLCELKGLRVGNAQVSPKHPNFIVNLGNAKSSDVGRLIGIAKERVRQKFGVNLEEEISYL